MNDRYEIFDRAEINNFLFQPRKETGFQGSIESYKILSIPVDEGIKIGGRFYHSEKNSANILFFHGNGEIVSDYHDLAVIYKDIGINFIPVDYRGYGTSGGSPSVTSMIEDSHKIFTFIKDWLKDNKYSGPLIIMGRSLGSASALELANQYTDDIDALIIESGFANIIPLLNTLGINTAKLGLSQEVGFMHLEKIKKFMNPVLIIHAELDHIIPFTEGEALYREAVSEDKYFVQIPYANHNTIFSHGLREYMNGIKKLITKI